MPNATIGSPDFGFTPEHIDDFRARGLSPQQAYDAGVRAVTTTDDLPEGCPDYWTAEIHQHDEAGLPDWAYLPGRLYRFDSPDGDTTEYQLKPDRPEIVKGRAKKYIFRKGAASILHAARAVPPTPETCVLIVEGTHQPLVAAAYAPADVAVFGIAGAQSWFKAGLPTNDLFIAEDQPVLICLDADGGSNRQVYDAGVKLANNLRLNGATDVRFIRLGDYTGGTNGLDDFLGSMPEARRTRAIEGLIGQARAMKPIDKPHLPARKMPDAAATSEAEEDEDAVFTKKGSLRAKTASRLITDAFPAALTSEFTVALYKSGVFKITPLAFIGACTELMGENYKPTHRGTIEEFTAGQLANKDAFLPNNLNQPLVNLINGMLDLRTDELLEHDPAYMSNVQFPVEWSPDAKCPRYEAWLREQVGDQMDALEEVTAQMLNPAATPVHTLFLFGESRTGKGTYLRLMQAMVGGVDGGNVSAESLHKLVTDQFSAANLYGKVLNVAADLASTPIEDVSMYKMLTGQDPIPANRKYGKQFTFICRAMQAFATNEVPQVAETSNAWSGRQRPFEFRHSFMGREDHRVEDALMAELPGILVRWVRAWQRRQERGHELPEDPIVRLMFELKSNKVRKFILEACDVVPTETASVQAGVTVKELYRQFVMWCEEDGVRPMQQGKFADRLKLVPGVREVRFGPDRVRGFNLKIRPSKQWESVDITDLLAQVTTDKYNTDISNATSESADKSDIALSEILNQDTPSQPSTEERADRAEVPYKRSMANGYMSLTSDKTYISPPIEGVGENPPDLPARFVPPVPAPRSGDLIDSMFESVHHDPSPCTDCGSAQVLVEPHRAWYACSQCYPATTRHSSERTSS